MDSGLSLQVRGSRVLIRPEDQRETTRPSGLIAVTAHSPDVIGTVIAIGDGVQDVREDDVVLFTPESGQTMEFNGTKYLVVQEDELLAIWHEEQPTV